MPLSVPDRAFDAGVNSITQLLTLIFIFVVVVVIAMLATRFIVKYQRGANNAANIEVIETYRLTANKFVQIVRVGEKYLAIAIGKDEVSFLTELSPDELTFAPQNDGVMPDFAGLLAKFKDSFGDKDKA